MDVASCVDVEQSCVKAYVPSSDKSGEKILHAGSCELGTTVKNVEPSSQQELSSVQKLQGNIFLLFIVKCFRFLLYRKSSFVIGTT